MKFLKFAFLFFCITAFSQTKVGTINVDYILGQMPELKNVQTEVDTYGKSLETDLKNKLETYDAEIQKYQAEEASLTLNQRKVRQDSIIAMEDDISKYQTNAQKMLALKRDQLLQPLYQKIGAEMQKIAETEGFTQIFQTNGNLVYSDNRYDITIAVAKALGIEIKEEEGN